jgi:sucrose phosphorylase
MLVTETNVPNRENLAYFGDADEAHLIYNFSLPPLLLHALYHGRSDRLSHWTMHMPPAPVGCAYFNFMSSHDGVGVRPAEGLLSDEEIDELVEITRRLGGRHNSYLRGDEERPYELNIGAIDAFGGTVEGPESEHQMARFICAHTILLGLEGVPGLFIHSLLATPGDTKAVETSGNNRAMNRAKLNLAEVEADLTDSSTLRCQAFETLCHLLSVRRGQVAFNPNATQFTLQLGPGVFGFWRQDRDRTQSIFAIHNVTDRTQSVPLLSLNLIDTHQWRDLITGQPIDVAGDEVVLGPYHCQWISDR